MSLYNFQIQINGIFYAELQLNAILNLMLVYSWQLVCPTELQQVFIVTILSWIILCLPMDSSHPEIFRPWFKQLNIIIQRRWTFSITSFGIFHPASCLSWNKDNNNKNPSILIAVGN